MLVSLLESNFNYVLYCQGARCWSQALGRWLETTRSSACSLEVW